MTTNTTRRVARLFALPIISAGILAGALRMAGIAGAGTYTPDNAAAGHRRDTEDLGAAGHGCPHNYGITHLQRAQPTYHP